jgi:Coenzyme PQQ synthesis protein D (PqqD)
MEGSERYASSGRVVHETIDGETILIHLDTGAYYSLDGSGAAAWELLASGSSQPAVAESLARAYDADADADTDAIADALRSLVADLAAEGLLEPAPEPTVNGHVPVAAVVSDQPRAAFVMPILRKYTDMQEFLLVDPIHETDDTGWPNAAPAEHG